MRSSQMLRALRRARPVIDGELTSKLLLAAMLQPFGWWRGRRSWHDAASIPPPLHLRRRS